MKHTIKVTAMLVLFFFAAQLAGLLIINQYIDHKKTAETKEVVMKPLPYGFERPEVKNQSASFIYIMMAVLIGTLLVFALIKVHKSFILKICFFFLLWIAASVELSAIMNKILAVVIALVISIITIKIGIFKVWFFITVWLTLSIAFAAFLNGIAAAAIALSLAALKFFKPNIILHNVSEIFIYGGLAAIFVPIMNLFAAFMLLLFISIYDYISVFKTKHMIKLAEFQSDSKIFAGLFIPYKIESEKIDFVKKSIFSKSSEAKMSKSKGAILGGGDIGFTLMFAGVVMKGLMLKEALLIGFLKTLIIPVFAALALLILLLKGQQNKFYPAMPVLSAGCAVGYLAVWLFG